MILRAAILFSLFGGFPPFTPPSLAQTPSSRPSQSKTQKLANPLNDLLDEAQRAIDKNDFEAAIPPLQKFIAEKPDEPYGHFQLAYVYTALKRFDDARAEYQRSIQLNPKLSEAQLNLGILLLDREPAAAVAPLRKSVELLPAQSRPRILLAMALERSGDSAAAAESFEQALRLDPRDLEALLHLGNLDLHLQRPADAEPKFRSALEIDPDSSPAALGLAQSLKAQNRPEAADAYQKYLALHPEDPAAKTAYVRSLFDEQKYDEALAALDRATEGQPPSLQALKLRADIQIARKKFDDAVVALQQAVALAPRDAQLLGGLGRTYLQKRDFPNAEKSLRAALQLEPNNLVFWKDLGSTYYLSGNCPATLSTLDLIAKAEPPSPGSWFIRGLCYDKLKQFKPALEAYDKFLSMEQGKNSDQVWQAQQRSKVLRHMLEAKRQ